MNLGFGSADVDVSSMIAEFFNAIVLSKEDLSKLAQSEIPEVREAFVSNLTDQVLLAKIAVEDNASNVRLDAVNKLTDQILLTTIAQEDKDYGVCIAAKKRLEALRAGKS